MNQIAAFDVTMCHGQLVVCNLGYEFNDWRPQHIDQGFTWRIGSVSFSGFSSDDACAIEVYMAEKVNLKSDTVRAILVPFSVLDVDIIVVTDVFILSRQEIAIAQGNYALVFEYGYRQAYYENPEFREEYALFMPTWCRLTFIAAEITHAEILRADADLKPSYPLLMEAKPA